MWLQFLFLKPFGLIFLISLTVQPGYFYQTTEVERLQEVSKETLETSRAVSESNVNVTSVSVTEVTDGNVKTNPNVSKSPLEWNYTGTSEPAIKSTDNTLKTSPTVSDLPLEWNYTGTSEPAVKSTDNTLKTSPTVSDLPLEWTYTGTTDSATEVTDGTLNDRKKFFAGGFVELRVVRDNFGTYLNCTAVVLYQFTWTVDFEIQWLRNQQDLKLEPSFDVRSHSLYDGRLKIYSVVRRIGKDLPTGEYIVRIISRAWQMKNNIKIDSDFNDVCDGKGDCGPSMHCNLDHRCVCRRNFVLIRDFLSKKFKCFKGARIGENCLFSQQCELFVKKTICYKSNNKCGCEPGYMGLLRCTKDPHHPLPKEIYKAAMVALLCFIMVVISCLIFFLCNRSYPRRRSSVDIPIDDEFTNHMFNVADELGSRRRLDKPPTYQDIIAHDQLIRGLPPPAYHEAMAVHGTGRGIVQVPTISIEVRPAGQPGTSSNRDTGLVNPVYEA